MSDDRIEELGKEWMMAKEREREAVEKRREIEDELAKVMEVNSMKDGTLNYINRGMRIKITSRLNRKVDANMIQDIARENNISHDILNSVVRWKAELNLASWKNTDEAITDVLVDAITTVPSRPSFQITQGE